MMKGCKRLPTFLLGIGAAVVFAATAAQAMTADELTASIRSASSSSRSLARKTWDTRAEEKLVGRIDRLADAFHDLAAGGAAIPETAAALTDLLASVRKRYTDVLEEMQAEVIRIDGDLEAVQDSAAWREREILAMRILYRLNWIRYERAMRYETSSATRKRLLQQAATGFGEFLGSGDAALTAEALLGRGLTAKAMKQYDRAIEDFKTALAQNPDAEMKARIRIALVEAELATGNVNAALDTSRRLIAAAKPGGAAALLRPQALFLRSKTLLLASPSAGAAATGMRAETATMLEELYGLGGYWRSKVVQLVDAGMDDPEAWADVSASPFVTWLVADSFRRRDECDRAVTLYDGLLEADRFVQESLFGRGYCRFQDGRYAQSLDDLGHYIQAAGPDGALTERAAYLRFKASESLFLQATPAEREAAGELYLTNLTAFVEVAPEHERAFEAWFRLGEWHRDRSEYDRCADAFSKVRGDRAFEIKASFLSAQCRVELVIAAPDDSPVPPEQVTAAIDALDGFLEACGGLRAGDSQSAAAEQQRTLAPLEAKATLMAAALMTRSGIGSMEDRIRRLDRFEERYPGSEELFPEVRSLRIVAYRTTGDLDAAGVQLEALLAADTEGAWRGDSLRKLGIVFLEEGARREEAGDGPGAARSRRVALRIYETLLSDARNGGPVPPEGIAGLEQLVNDLRTSSGG